MTVIAIADAAAMTGTHRKFSITVT
jgi:hypothetical protein